MCGRFETKPSLQTLVNELKKHKVDLVIELDSEKRKTENIAPTNKIFSISYSDTNYKLSYTNWGIKFSPTSPLIFNSRIETIKEKKYWMTLFSKNRLLVPMSAFYEWKKEGTKKIPCKISLKSEDMFFVPGLYNKDKEGNKTISLITTEPNEFMKSIHNRMPVILNLKEATEYLNAEAEDNLQRCIPYKDSDNMEMEVADI
jgi:putative SOS response-associated peptidase YedK